MAPKFDYEIKMKREFTNATGLTIKDNALEYSNWLRNLKLSAMLYKELLSEKGINCDSQEIVEINKGYNDTIIEDGFKAILITEFADSFFDKGSKYNLIDGKFRVLKCMPTYKFRNYDEKSINNIFDENGIAIKFYKRFLTHNPIHPDELDYYIPLLSTGNDLTIGVHGSLEDKDRTKKLSEIVKLTKRIPSSYCELFEKTDDKSYAYIMSTNLKR